MFFDTLSTVDRDGLLTRKELCEGLIQEGYEKHDVEKRLPLLFGSLDKDGDGEITKQEFVDHLHMMNKIDTDVLPPTPHADEVWGQGFARSEVASEGWGSGYVSDSPGKYYQSHAVIAFIACLHMKYDGSVTLSLVSVRRPSGYYRLGLCSTIASFWPRRRRQRGRTNARR